MIMQPFLMQPMMVYCTPTFTSEEAWKPSMCKTENKRTTTEEVPEETGQKAYNESDEDVYYHIAEAYDHAGQWHEVEKNLFIRASKLPNLENCYIQGNNGDYKPWGSKAADCQGLLDRFSHGLVHLSLAQMEAHMLTKEKSATSICGLKVGLREIRTHPSLIGIAVFEDGRKCFLEASWKEANKKEPKHHLENDLLVAIIRCRKPQEQIVFW